MRDNDVEYLAKYILEFNLTIRETAKRLDIPKSTLHYKVTRGLKKVNPMLYQTLHEYLENNFNEKHIRGGNATKKKWQESFHHKK